MRCPYCTHPESKVVDSRPADEGTSIRRRRECLECHKRFTTYETVESLPLVVIKKDASRQTFDKTKLLNGMLRACEKRPVSLAELDRIANAIEQSRGVDEVAYVRFASVYRQFKDINTFMSELTKLLEEKA